MQITTTEKNAAFNPLFAKMQERFCAGGTIAEKMAIEAGLTKKRARRAVVSARTTGGDAASSRKEKRGLIKSLFNLKNLGAIAMGILLTSVLFLSGASFSGIREGLAANTPADVLPETQITDVEESDATNVIYFADESTPVHM